MIPISGRFALASAPKPTGNLHTAPGGGGGAGPSRFFPTHKPDKKKEKGGGGKKGGAGLMTATSPEDVPPGGNGYMDINDIIRNHGGCKSQDF